MKNLTQEEIKAIQDFEIKCSKDWNVDVVLEVDECNDNVIYLRLVTEDTDEDENLKMNRESLEIY